MDRAGHHQPEIKQESAIQAVVAAQRELSDQQLDRSEEEEEEVIRRRTERSLVRRPSYRKILTELGGHHNMIQGGPEERGDQSGNDSGTSNEDINNPEDRLGGSLADRLANHHNQQQQQQDRHSFNDLPQPLRVVPTGSLLGNGVTMSIGGGGGGGNEHLHTTPAPLQYSPHSENGGYYGNPGLGNLDDSTRKREIRLLKNREAARECRRKKKEYIKCLENRVAVLENQNKALIEELKNLKELYTGGKMG